MKLLKILALAAIVSVGLTACLKDKAAEEVPTEQVAPTEAAPVDSGTGTPEAPAQ